MARLVNLANFQQFAAINVLTDPGALGGPVVIPSCAQLRLLWTTGSGKAAHNVLTVRYNGAFAGSAAQLNSILTGLTTGAQWTALSAHIAPTAGLVAADIRDINQPNQPIIPSTGAGAVGTSSGSELPNEVAVCVTLRTAFTGPQNRGRLYVPGWATTALGANNTIAAAAVTALTNWSSIIAGVLSAQGYTWCIGHPARQAYTGSTGTVHPARVAGSVPITTISVRDNHWDSQRRRGLK
jgi:hypothetical protein